MAMPVVGGAFLQVAFDRLASSEVMDFVRRWEIDLNEVKNLEWTSAMIQALTDEAEVKQFTRPAVKLMLNRLKQLLYDAEDILDEYATDILKVKLLESQSQTHPDEKVRNPVALSPSSSESSSVSSSLNSSIESFFKGFINPTSDEIKGIPRKVFDTYEKLRGIKEYGSKVKEMNDRLKGAAKEGSDLGLSLGTIAMPSRPGVFSQRPPTTSLVNKNSVFGRDEDKEKIIEFLLRDEATAGGNKFSVLPIVGMGGLGKTTLAQLVYDADRLIQHFDLKAWVCVGEEFDIWKITKIILESVTGKKPETDLPDRLQNKLQQELSEKKFLMVLDDVWNLNSIKWDNLTTPFAAGAHGSKIVVTTRDKGLSSMMGAVTAHQLERLSDEACIHLLRKHAFVNGNSLDADRKLEIFGSKVAKKCKGLPLAVKTIAGLLRDKTEDSEWEAVLENEIWDLEEDKSEILPSLMLSYHHLSPHLKRCFAYCALFPKDFEFEKIDLVKLWMAEGFVQSKETKRLEDIGEGYFDVLFRRSFFELSNRPSESNKPTWSFGAEFYYDDDLQSSRMWQSYLDRMDEEYFSQNNNLRSSNLFVMHDLIHDLAQFVSSEIYCRIEGDKPSKISATTRHLSYHMADRMKSSKDIKDMKSLRTLLFPNGFPSYEPYLPTTHQHLRVLRLIGCSICELPCSIGNLKHLRLLDLSRSYKIMSLPDSIGSLYNLQTLILSGCGQLRELPKDMGDLVNLRHLFLPDQCSEFPMIEKMPLRFGSLTNLQTLTEFIVGLHTSDSSRIGELRDLSQLRGTLKISNLENVGNTGTDDIEANLKNKSHLRELWLCWSDYKSKDRFPNSRDEKVEENVLDQLQPHTNIEMLRIVNYGGTRFPSWVGHRSFSNLETVILRHCHNCIVFPYLGQLSSLKYLMIDRCSALKITGDDDSSVSKKFQSLETLIIYHMTEWEEWFEVVEEGHDGEDFPCLHNLTIRDCPKLTTVSHRFSSLVTLTVENCNELRELPRILPSLQQLKIEVCEKLLVLPSLPSIQRLALCGCHQITTLFGSQHPSSSSSSSSPHVCVSNIEEDGEGEFRCLRELYIFCCPNLRKLASTVPSLVKLRIEACKELSFLPMLPSIEKLKLKQCNKLEVGKVSEFSSLSYLYMKDVSNLSLPCGYFRSLTALQQLEIYSFNELMMVGLKHLTSLKRLVISKCPKLLSFLPDNDEEEGEGLDLPSCIEYLDLSYCDSLKKLPQSLCNLHCLKELIIKGDAGLACLPKGLDKLTFLQKLEISECSRFVSLAEVMLPIRLQFLYFEDCHNLESLTEGLHNLKCLKNMQISKCPSLVSLAEVMLPIGLQFLYIYDCHNLESLPEGLHNLTSLEGLIIINCPALESFPDMGLPTTLVNLTIEKCVKLNSLPMGLHKLRNFRRLSIVECSFLMECKNLEPPCSLGLQNFTSLDSLHIGGCPNLVSIPKGLLPINLVTLNFTDCPILESLHDGLSDLNSLKYLNIKNCPMLKQRYQQKKGKEWSKIAQLPSVVIAD